MAKKTSFVVTGAKLEKRRKAVLDEWQERELAKKKAKEAKAAGLAAADFAKPYDEPTAYLKRAIYSTVRVCLRNDGLDVLHKSVTDMLSKTSPKVSVRMTPKNAENPFFLGMVLITGNVQGFNRNYRIRYSRELLYAHLHDVPPYLLIGFIYQIGSSDDIGRRLRDEEFEIWCGKLPATVTAKKLRRIKDPLAPPPEASRADS